MNRKVYYPPPEKNYRPGKAFIPVLNTAQPAALEVTLTYSLQSGLIMNVSEKSGFEMSAAADRKYEQYAQNCSETRIEFIPLFFETFGGFLETDRKTLKRIATLTDNRGKQSSIREKARLLSLSLPQSGAWLSAATNPALGLHLSPNEFCVALKYRLGVKATSGVVGSFQLFFS